MYRQLLQLPKRPRLVTLVSHHRVHGCTALRLPRQARPRVLPGDVWDGLDGISPETLADLHHQPPERPRRLAETERLAEKEEAPPVTDWQAYVSDRFSGSSPEMTSLERQAFTSFGSIRMDHMNVPQVDGQEELYQEEMEKREAEAAAADDLEEDAGKSTQGVTQLRSRCRSMFASHERERNFFFEDEADDSVAVSFQGHHPAKSSSSPRSAAATRTVAAEDFSFRPAVRNVRSHFRDKKDVATLRPEFVENVASSSDGGQGDSEFIDNQYFSTTSDGTEDSSSSVMTGKETVKIPKQKMIACEVPQDLNEFDFGNARYVDIKVETDQNDLEKVRRLVKESTGDLSYIDSQIFEQPPQSSRAVSDTNRLEPKSVPNNSNRIQSIKNHSATMDEPQNFLSDKRDSKKEKKSKNMDKLQQLEEPTSASQQKTLTKVSQEIKKKEVDRPKTVGEFRSASPNSALDYVQKLRREKAVTQTRGKEQLVDEIGVSLQRRLTIASKEVTVDDLRERSEKEARQEAAVHDEQSIILTRLDPKFKPINLRDATSLEVIEMLQTNIIYNDNDIFAINKPYGLPMFGKDEPHTVEKYLPKLAAKAEVPELYQVHRLDRTTSGVVLFAKSKAMHKTLTDLFRRRMIDKRYWAIVRSEPQPNQGIIDIPLAEGKIEEKYRMTVQPNYKTSEVITNKRSIRRDTFPAVTEYRVLTTHGHASLLEVKPITGFKHQIRVHLGLGLGCPIIGDHKYTYIDEIGKPQKLAGEVLHRLGIRQSRVRDLPLLLHAKHIQIPEIVEGKQVWIDAALPHYFNRAMKKLKLKPKNFVAV